jgi:subtilisin family serine protease
MPNGPERIEAGKTYFNSMNFPCTQEKDKCEAGNDEKADPGDTFSPETLNTHDMKRESFIVLPPDSDDESPAETGANKTLEKLGIEPKEELEIIDGYLVDVNSLQQEQLKEAGYQIFKNEKVQIIPNPEDEQKEGGTPQRPSIEDKINSEYKKLANGLKTPGKPDGVRFNTELASQYTGKGVTIAVLDSGIYPHPDFTQPENRLKEFVDVVHGKKIPYDDNGHGTHVAGCAVGNGFTDEESLYKAPASEADLISVKVTSGDGGGNISHIIKGIQYCIENKDKHNIRVINMSLGFPPKPGAGPTPLDLAVKAAYDAGIVVVAAAGNEGPGEGTVGSPANNPYVIAVGSVDDNNTTMNPEDDRISVFSSRGEEVDVVAPGSAIIATTAPGSELNKDGKMQMESLEVFQWLNEKSDEELLEVPKPVLTRLGVPPYLIDAWNVNPQIARNIIRAIHSANQTLAITQDGAYQAMDGTSMASPMTSAIIAKMIQANPDLTPEQVGKIVRDTANPLPGDVPVTAQGHGKINPDGAVEESLKLKEESAKNPSDLKEARKVDEEVTLPTPTKANKDLSSITPRQVNGERPFPEPSKI